MFQLRSSARLLLILASVAFVAAEVRADSISIGPSTSLLNGTTFTSAQTYYAVFQLVGGGTDNNGALLSNFNLGGGATLLRDPLDPSSGSVQVGPTAGDLSGIGQANSTLQFVIMPGDSFAVYSQRISAGAVSRLTWPSPVTTHREIRSTVLRSSFTTWSCRRCSTNSSLISQVPSRFPNRPHSCCWVLVCQVSAPFCGAEEGPTWELDIDTINRIHKIT
jgi:hypothetical protein